MFGPTRYLLWSPVIVPPSYEACLHSRGKLVNYSRLVIFFCHVLGGLKRDKGEGCESADEFIHGLYAAVGWVTMQAKP